MIRIHLNIRWIAIQEFRIWIFFSLITKASNILLFKSFWETGPSAIMRNLGRDISFSKLFNHWVRILTPELLQTTITS